MRHVVAAADQASKFHSVTGAYSRISSGGTIDGWQCLEDAAGCPGSFTPYGETLASDPLLLYFTSGTSYPVGHLSTMYWIGLQPGELEHQFTRMGQTCVELRFRSLECGRYGVHI